MKVCWNLTNKCNEDCEYCFRELFEKERSLDDNFVILEKLKDLGVESITFAGGEPLLYYGFYELLKKAKEMGFKTKVITNGKLLTGQNLGKYLKYLDKLTFSIDSSNTYVNECIGRGPNHYEHIKTLLPYIKLIKPEIELEINSVVSRNTIQELDYMYESLSSELACYGIKKWKISRFSPLRGHAKDREYYLSITDEEFQEIRQKFEYNNGLFRVVVRDIDDVNDNIIVSPCGALKGLVDGVETILIEDVKEYQAPSFKEENPGKRLVLGGIKHV